MSEIIGPLDFMVALCYLFPFCLLLVSGATEEIHSYHTIPSKAKYIPELIS